MQWADLPLLFKFWSMTPKSSRGLHDVAALIKYGLLEDQGSGAARQVRLTETARLIIGDRRPGSLDRQRLIREAALKPSIHQEMWESLSSDVEWPSDDSIHYDLTMKKRFTPSGAKEFMREFKATIEFAGLRGGIIEASDDERDTPPPSPAKQPDKNTPI